MEAPILVTHHRSSVTTVKASHLPLIQLSGQKWQNWKTVTDKGVDVRNSHLGPNFKEKFLGSHRLTITTTFTITSDQFSSSWRLGLNQTTIILQDPSVHKPNHKPTALSRLIFVPMTVSYIRISLPTSISALCRRCTWMTWIAPRNEILPRTGFSLNLHKKGSSSST